MKVESCYDIILNLDEDQRKKLFQMFNQKNNSSPASSVNYRDIVKANLEALRLYDANNTCMTVEEAAEYFKVHKNTILHKIHKGEIKSEFFGRTHRIPKMQFIEKIINEG
ncbi:helix-turn-helix domain-containing protein [Antarcticibacterium flavum]|uniref:Helix-turn-helix domain-containing protein n=1 Tax=Antarcticibacterium flavum TaxID=2058175 RepID=A0A5B7X805_9FLAO|nr:MULTISPECIES: excisionase family DNA-binding protein [Antarcticibacterium]MCM4159530.1 hypothetical protein [Antarcticibacterium sp. W02-3]QCY70783.1 helix-turn-helix domain-containing protein [Antarcticibacterium flavum]